MASAAARRCWSAASAWQQRPWVAAVGGARGYAGAAPARGRGSHARNRERPDERTMSQMEKQAVSEMLRDGGGPLFPGTFVSLPLSQYPRSPAKFLQYQWARYRSWLEGSLSVLQVKLRSMPSWTRRPRWRAARRRIAPAAKALYREVLEAFAQGDRATLSRVCVRAFGTRLIAAVDRRSPRERVRFDLVRYNRPLLYPRLLSHRIHAVNPHDRDSATEQAVVAIASTQQASRHSFDTGALIPGSLKLQDKIEYVVLSRNLNVKTYESSPWRVWGTTSATSLDEYVKEQAALEKEQAQRAGF